MKKQLWIDLRNWDKTLATLALESGVDAIVVEDEHVEELRELGKVQIIAENDGDFCLFSENNPLTPPYKEDTKCVAEITIRQKEDEDTAVKLPAGTWKIIHNKDWTIIPLENLISKTDHLVQSVANAGEADLALKTMERGADGVLLQTTDVNQIKKTADMVRSAGEDHFELELVKITVTKEMTINDRCCVDTASILPPGSGLLVGDSVQAMFLVHNENVESPFCAARPFRVNAGAVHAYVRLPNNKTKYLSEVNAGDEVVVVDHTGKSTTVGVGRNKIEKRPMLLVQAEAKSGRRVSLVLQNAETIRLVSVDGSPKSVTRLEIGDEVLAHLGSTTGRHFGQEIEETITEK